MREGEAQRGVKSHVPVVIIKGSISVNLVVVGTIKIGRKTE